MLLSPAGWWFLSRIWWCSDGSFGKHTGGWGQHSLLQLPRWFPILLLTSPMSCKLVGPALYPGSNSRFCGFQTCYLVHAWCLVSIHVHAYMCTHTCDTGYSTLLMICLALPRLMPRKLVSKVIMLWLRLGSRRSRLKWNSLPSGLLVNKCNNQQ